MSSVCQDHFEQHPDDDGGLAIDDDSQRGRMTAAILISLGFTLGAATSIAAMVGWTILTH